MTHYNTNTMDKQIQQDKKRCHCCNVKVGYLGFKCRCVGADGEPFVYCSQCRHSKSAADTSDVNGHLCNFDFRQFGKERIENNNPKIESRKIDVI
jgi:hypothetical protein